MPASLPKKTASPAVTWFMHAALITGLTILFALACCLLLQAALYLLSFPLSPLAPTLAALASIGFIWLMAGKYLPQHRRVSSLLLCASLAVIGLGTLWVSTRILDTSADGQAYHASGILALENGWNPVRDEPLDSTDPNSHAPYVNSYPKGTWILAASIYQATGRIEAGKALHLLLLVACLGIALYALWSAGGFSFPTSVLLSVLISLNPVFIYQAFSFYVDGQLAILITIFLCLLALWVRKPDRALLALIGLTLLLLVNVKLTGLVYAGLLGAGLGAYACYKTRRKEILLALGLGLFFGVTVVGYNPYFTNLARYRNPFYPAINFDNPETVIASADIPPNLRDKNRFEKLFISLFSASEAGIKGARFKLPFTVSQGELEQFVFPDVRIAGFGPLFSGALLLSGSGLLLAWIFRVPGAALATGAGALLLFSALTNPESWWARYVPQLWLLPLLAVLVLVASKRKWIRLLGFLTGAILLANLILILAVYVPGQ